MRSLGGKFTHPYGVLVKKLTVFFFLWLKIVDTFMLVVYNMNTELIDGLIRANLVPSRV